MMLRVFEAFSGYGSQRIALRNLGIEHEVVAISEIDKYAIKSYEAIHGDTLNLGDISKINTSDIPDHDLFTYSFPCQDISISGKQCGLDIGSGTRSGLLWECQKVISIKKPKYLLLENVKNLVGKRHKDNFDKWLEWLESQGYTNYWDILNSKDYGIPQNRERVFVVSILGDHTSFEFTHKQQYLKVKLGDVLEDTVSPKYIINNDILKLLTPRIPRKSSDIIQIFEYNTPTRKNSNRYRVYDVNGISPTLGTMQGGGLQPCLKLGTTIRKITPNECWRLMGVSDDDFYKAKSVNSNTQLYKQAGNSIVVPVLESIFKELFTERMLNDV